MKNEYTVTRKLWKSWVKESQFKGKRLFFFVTGCILIAVCIAGILFSAWVLTQTENAKDRSTLSLYIYLYALFGLFFAYRNFLFPIIAANKQYTRYANLVGQEDFTRTILFEEDIITMKEGTMAAQFAYTDITEIIERDDLVMMHFRNGAGIRFFRSTFVDSDWASCKTLIEEKRTAEARDA